ncbi:lantibiotic immunity ABC transporter MutG family permease subunit [uncultured Robinsoniella sp.]|uniref:lantibiotic immunity ABC transporter MutG family permease subunit n=1 Tax=uncultured Robinsoniella sp. TaxID=904190 RepID=UPI00374FBB9B
MRSLWYLLKADFIKMKHTAFYPVHILVPLLGNVLFLAYFMISPWEPSGKIQAYLEVVAIAFPLIGAVVTAMAAEQEAMAEGFKEMLSQQYPRWEVWFSKFLMLFLTGLAADIFAIFTFWLGFRFLVGGSEAAFSIFAGAALIIIFCQIIMYTVHLMVGIRFGRGALMGLAVVECLVTALMLTGLGEGLWMFLPCAWGARLCDYFMLYFQKGLFFNQVGPYTAAGILGATLIVFLLYLIWSGRFEGRRN